MVRHLLVLVVVLVLVAVLLLLDLIYRLLAEVVALAELGNAVVHKQAAVAVAREVLGFVHLMAL
jgi:hypothetical protein